MEKNKFSYKLFGKGFFAACLVSLLIWGMYSLYKPSPKEVGLADSTDLGGKPSVPVFEKIDPFGNLRDDMERQLSTLFADKQANTDSFGRVLKDTENRQNMASEGGQNPPAVNEDLTVGLSGVIKEVVDKAYPVNIQYLEVKQKILALKDGSLLEKLKSVGTIKKTVEDHLVQENNLKKYLLGIVLKKPKEQELIDIFKQLNQLHLTILTTGLSRLDKMEEKLDDLLQMDAKAEILFNKSTLLIKELKGLDS